MAVISDSHRFRKGVSFLVAAVLSSWSVIGQSDSAWSVLPQVEVSAGRLRDRPVGAHVGTMDSAATGFSMADNLADRLKTVPGIYIKDYGPGSLATSSIRGGSAGQTAVIWNGLPIQSPMLGQLDFSLLPAVLFDDLAVSYGGGGSTWGSGAVGGAVLLDNHHPEETGLSARLLAASGSFGRRDYAGVIRYGKGDFFGSTRPFLQHSDNDFPFQPAPSLPSKKQPNAAVRQTGILQELGWKIASRQEAVLRVWRQKADREIPPTLTQTRSEAVQADRFTRLALHWKKTGNSTVWQARAGYFTENLDYQDPLSAADSRSRFVTGLGEVELAWIPSGHNRVQGAVSTYRTRAETGAYAGPASQSRSALFGAWKHEENSWTGQLDARVETVDGHLSPFMPGVGLEGRIFRFLTLTARAGRHYRLPTLNDLYWQPGGNPELLPENGWNEEFGVDFHTVKSSFRVQFTATAYHRRIKNWILWAPLKDRQLYSPQNIAAVRSRGVETRMNLTRAWHKATLKAMLGWDLTRSTNEIALPNPRIARGEQLFYVPVQQAVGSISFRYKAFQTTYRHRYAGPVNGINEDLPGFSIGAVELEHAFRFLQIPLRLTVQIGNLWDEDYRVVERRPMPGRFWRAGLVADLVFDRSSDSSP
ncbi:MAG: TonB-dependent receptor [Lewinella sp.]|nr:TonB-dependent receptor [Lewinella sp.]